MPFLHLKTSDLTQSKSQSLKITDKTLIWLLATLFLYPLFTQLQTPSPLPFFENNTQAPDSGFLHFLFLFLGRLYLKSHPSVILTSSAQVSSYHWVLPDYLVWNIKNNNSPSLFPVLSSNYYLTNYIYSVFLVIVADLLPPQEQGLPAFLPAMSSVPKRWLEHIRHSKIFLFFLATLSSLWDLSSLTRDWTWAHGSESAES